MLRPTATTCKVYLITVTSVIDYSSVVRNQYVCTEDLQFFSFSHAGAKRYKNLFIISYKGRFCSYKRSVRIYYILVLQ